MLYTAGEIILFLVASAAVGILIGYLTWGRTTSASTNEITSLQRQLTATRKRAAAAESDATKRGQALAEARVHFDAQQARIKELEVATPPTPTSQNDEFNGS